MNKNITEAIELANSLKRELFDVKGCEIVICPAFTALAEISEVISNTNIKLGAQNMHWEKEGAFTGEVSAPMLKDVGCEYVILGHSERRQFFAETNQMINKKIRSALTYAITPIVCVGEIIEERKQNKTFQVVGEQLKGCLKDLTPEEIGKIVIAYEPVWAIGTGLTATPQQAQEVHSFIRRTLLEMTADEKIANGVTIQYGGSVKPENIRDLIKEEDIDGALVGGASLDANSFLKIIKNSLGIKR